MEDYFYHEFHGKCKNSSGDKTTPAILSLKKHISGLVKVEWCKACRKCIIPQDIRERFFKDEDSYFDWE